MNPAADITLGSGNLWFWHFQSLIISFKYRIVRKPIVGCFLVAAPMMNRPIIGENTTLCLYMLSAGHAPLIITLMSPAKPVFSFILGAALLCWSEKNPTVPAKLLPTCVTAKWKKTDLTAALKSLRIQQKTRRVRLLTGQEWLLSGYL